MDPLEQLLERDRKAGVPEPPDVRYTVAAVRRRAGLVGPQAQPKAELLGWAPFVAAACTLPALGLGLLYLGLSPWWLLLPPLSLLAISPILLRKGV